MPQNFYRCRQALFTYTVLFWWQLRPLGNFPQLLSLQLRRKGYGTLAARSRGRLSKIFSSFVITTTRHTTTNAIWTTRKKRPDGAQRRHHRHACAQCTWGRLRGSCRCCQINLNCRTSPGHPTEAGVVHCLESHLTVTQIYPLLYRSGNSKPSTHQCDSTGVPLVCLNICTITRSVCSGQETSRLDTIPP